MLILETCLQKALSVKMYVCATIQHFGFQIFVPIDGFSLTSTYFNVFHLVARVNMTRYDVFNRDWVDTQWQQYTTHLHTNNTQYRERNIHNKQKIKQKNELFQ
jgi:hypothetical protein